MSMTLFKTISIRSLPGIGPATAEKFAQCGVHSAWDALLHWPLRYEDKTQVMPLAGAPLDTPLLITAQVLSVKHQPGHKKQVVCVLSDTQHPNPKRITVRFFHLRQPQANALSKAHTVACYGKLQKGRYGLEMMHPDYMICETPDHNPMLEATYTPVYPTTAGLTQTRWRKLISQACSLFKAQTQDLVWPQGVLPTPFTASLAQCLEMIHHPPQGTDLSALIQRRHPANQRLIYEEILSQLTYMQQFRAAIKTQPACQLRVPDASLTQFLKQLPFELTGAQKKAWDAISQDLMQTNPMLRLLLGDVGTGKTVIAALTMLQTVSNDKQAVLLAPTEILAEQHLETLHAWFEPLGIEVICLTGRLTKTEKVARLEKIATGAVKVIVGTHALIQSSVVFHDLVTVIIDEQHRFGVAQRQALQHKAEVSGQHPHQLFMSATPIPRTQALVQFAQCDVSVLDEYPADRKKVITRAIDVARRDEIIERIATHCESKQQVYWLCPKIFEDDNQTVKSVEHIFELLRQKLPQLKIGRVHGQLPDAEKSASMQAFKQGEVDVLVATTVIEVGVNVPNATLMVIDRADRLGLAQLHQLRGRVGRGALASYCVLLYDTPLSDIAYQRLNTLREHHDGFLIAEQDLNLRGPGEILGDKQSGMTTYRLADLQRDSFLLPNIVAAAEALNKTHPEWVKQLWQYWLPTHLIEAPTQVAL